MNNICGWVRNGGKCILEQENTKLRIQISSREEIANELQQENKRLKNKIRKIIFALNYLDTDERRVKTIEVILYRELKEETMTLNKWNYETHKYDPYEIPDEWNVPLTTFLDEIVNCPQCGKELKYGKTYTSKEIHNKVGFGYGVCSECYEEEWKRRRNYEKTINE